MLKSRGDRVTDQFRRTAAGKLAKIQRMEPRVIRVEIEVIEERNPRQDGAKRLEASLQLPRRTFRAKAQGPDLDIALDQLVERLERQLRDHHGKRRNRLLGGGSRLKSPRISPEGAGTAD